MVKTPTDVSPPPDLSGPAGKQWLAMHEDPDNLRVLINGQQCPLRPHQRDALLQLRSGKKMQSISLDEDSRLWYHPVRTAAMRSAGTKPALCEIVQKGSAVAASSVPLNAAPSDEPATQPQK